jgi:hypothetical protein
VRLGWEQRATGLRHWVELCVPLGTDSVWGGLWGVGLAMNSTSHADSD